MSVQNLSFLGALESNKNFVVVGGGGGFQVSTMSKSNASCFRVALS